MIKKNWVYILFGLAVLLFVYTRILLPKWQKEHRQVAYKTFYVDSLHGWGYGIYINGKQKIHQSFIPAVYGRHAFISQSQAAIIAGLVVKKIYSREPSPIITKSEIDSCKIIIR